MKRTFIAADIFPGTPLLETFEKIRNLLKSERIAWVNPQQMHITIQFLGDTAEETLPLLIEKLSPVISDFKPFEFQILNAGVFKNRDDPKVLWMVCTMPDSMAQLQNAIKKTLAGFGYKGEERPFRPHITLGRIKGRADKNNLEKVLLSFGNRVFQSQAVEQLVFYESKLTPTGAQYTPFHTFGLGRS